VELLRALGALSEPPTREHTRIAEALGLEAPSAADHTELFVLQLPPYASIYLGEEGMIGGEARDRIAGFWRALGLVPPAEADHLAALLGLAAELAQDPAPEAAIAGRALAWEHLVSWLPVYLARVREVAPPVYVAWAVLLGGTLAEVEPGAALPAHLREATAPTEPTGLDDLLAGLLAPVRSGLLLTRADLARAAQETGLGLRMGERRFTLRALLEQDPAAALGWLGAEARRQAALWTGPLAAYWRERAGRMGALLDRLADAARVRG
jgi:TorA maturation chaperone TorD